MQAINELPIDRMCVAMEAGLCNPLGGDRGGGGGGGMVYLIGCFMAYWFVKGSNLLFNKYFVRMSDYPGVQ